MVGFSESRYIKNVLEHVCLASVVVVTYLKEALVYTVDIIISLQQHN